MNFVLENQNPDGSWYYAVDGRDFIDHFHTCFVMKALAKIHTLTGHRETLDALEKGVKYYLDNLFAEDGLPKPFSKAPRLIVYKRELYDCAECINLCLLLRDRFPQLETTLETVVAGVLQRLDQAGWLISFAQAAFRLGQRAHASLGAGADVSRASVLFARNICDQRSEVRDQKSALGDQRSATSGQRPDGCASGRKLIFHNERRRITDHASKHCSDFMALVREGCMIRFRQIFAIASEIEPRVGFAVLTLRGVGYEPEAIAVRQFADKMGLILSFSPCFSQIRTNGSRRTSDLIG